MLKFGCCKTTIILWLVVCNIRFLVTICPSGLFILCPFWRWCRGCCSFITKSEPDGPLVMKGQDVFKLAVSSSLKDIEGVIG
jgi:hypothetical protein